MFRTALVFVLLTSTAQAQSSLGITAVDFTLGQSDHDNEGSFGALLVDVAVTPYHGLQGDVVYEDLSSGGIGRLGAHLYMTPAAGQKYGLFAFVSDRDDASMTYGAIGAEGLFALSDTASVEINAGLGVANTDGLDYLFGSAAYHTDITPEFGLSAGAGFASFEEPGLNTDVFSPRIEARYSPDEQPFGVFARLSQDIFTDGLLSSSPTILSAGVSISFGGSSSRNRFTTTDPLAPLFRANLR